jgi:hypothetical protein
MGPPKSTKNRPKSTKNRLPTQKRALQIRGFEARDGFRGSVKTAFPWVIATLKQAGWHSQPVLGALAARIALGRDRLLDDRNRLQGKKGAFLEQEN